MHVGYSIGVQNLGNARSDEEVFARELRLADLAVDLGFDSVWAVEHHFTDYLISPDPVQLLTWLGAKYPHIRLGTGVIVLPWHEPVRCAEQIALLDNLSGGRLILGLGRGIARVEYDGFRVDMDSSRERFVEYAQLILDGLENGYIEGSGRFVDQPRRELRPRPQYSLRGRTYAGAMSPEAMPIMAQLGVGLLVIPQKPWPVVRADLDSYNAAWHAAHGPHIAPPAPLCGGHVFVDADARRAEEMAHRYIGAYYASVIAHYGFADNAHAGVKGYEFYASVSRHIGKAGADGAMTDYVRLMPWGNPDQVLEKLSALRDLIGMAAMNPWFSYAGMPVADAEANLRLFAREILPVLKDWRTPELAPVEPLALPLSLAAAAPASSPPT
jgi:alkanesulfonate monooxygenase SsuD/methylene tetrahydromethanopterin reductase-like flavin-dependent oxidoreductase (luciferase family)